MSECISTILYVIFTGIQKAREILKTQGRALAPRVAIVVTDGKSTYPDNTNIQSNMAKADGKAYY